MPYSRNQHSDRRRRFLRDAIATDPEYAVESARAKRRTKNRDTDSETEEEDNGSYRDPGYSQAVRRACQQRMVQFIPVRRSTLTAVIGSMWLVWALLVFAHYWIHIEPTANIPSSPSTASGKQLSFVDAPVQPASHTSYRPSDETAANKMRRKIFGEPANSQSFDDAVRFSIPNSGAVSSVEFAQATGPKQNAAPKYPNPANGSASQLASNFSLPPLRTLPIGQLFHLRSSHGIAHWLTCQFWMLTAIVATMIFQLRRHKLDDYRAKYRIWIFLAMVALFSSFDASSSALYLFGASIDGWARREIGYGGWPLVLATFASLVGILGLRLSTELKASRASVSLWVFGLLAWAVSALLGTDLIRTQYKPSTIDLIVGASWLGGILAVFQAAAIYLRQTYIHAQKRFLQRQSSIVSKSKWKMPSLSMQRKARHSAADEVDDSDEDHPSEKKRWRMPWQRNKQKDAPESRENERTVKSKRPTAQPEDRERTEIRSSTSHPRLASEQQQEVAISNDDASRESKSKDAPAKRRLFGLIPKREPVSKDKPGRTANRESTDGSNEVKAKKSWLPSFGRGSKQDANGKHESNTSSDSKANVTRPIQAVTKSETDASSTKKSWLSFGRGKVTKEPKESTKPVDKPIEKQPSASKSQPPQNEDREKKRGLFGFLDGLKLKPPAEPAATAKPNTSNKPTPVQSTRPLPSTSSATNNTDDDDDDDDIGNPSGRPMSKAERKRLRRMQQDDRRAA